MLNPAKFQFFDDSSILGAGAAHWIWRVGPTVIQVWGCQGISQLARSIREYSFTGRDVFDALGVADQHPGLGFGPLVPWTEKRPSN